MPDITSLTSQLLYSSLAVLVHFGLYSWQWNWYFYLPVDFNIITQALFHYFQYEGCQANYSTRFAVKSTTFVVFARNHPPDMCSLPPPAELSMISRPPLLLEKYHPLRLIQLLSTLPFSRVYLLLSYRPNVTLCIVWNSILRSMRAPSSLLLVNVPAFFFRQVDDPWLRPCMYTF